MTRDQFISLFFIALLVFVVYQIFQIFLPFLNAIFWAAILAFGFYPVYERLRQTFKNHDMPAALLTTTLIFLVVIPPLALVIVNVTTQAIELYQLAFNYVREGGVERFIEDIRSFAVIQSLEQRLGQWEPLKESLTTWLLNTTRAIGNFAASQVGSLTKNIFFVVLNTVLMFFLLFVFLIDGQKIYHFIYEVAPLEKPIKKPIFGLINETFAAVIRGQLLTGITQAVVAGVIFWILGIPVPILFATATFLAALIPVAGASMIWLPLAIYLAIQHHYAKAAILFILGLFVISLIDNIMKPALIGEKTKLPYFLLFFGILGGLKLYGLMGIFLAPAILAIFFALVKIYQQKFL